MTAACTKPPAGWACTRAAGHEGSCAAVAVEEFTRAELAKAVSGKAAVAEHDARVYRNTGGNEAAMDRLDKYARKLRAAANALAAQPPAPEGHWIDAQDVKRLVRELDVALNGEAGAATQASLCDVVGQVCDEARKIGRPLLAAQPPAPSDADIDAEWARHLVGNRFNLAKAHRNFVRAILARWGTPPTRAQVDAAPQPAQPLLWLNPKVVDMATGKVTRIEPLTWSDRKLGAWNLPVYLHPHDSAETRDAARWTYRRYGSEPEKGYTIVADREPIAYLGDGDVIGEAVDAICAAHNAALSATPTVSPASTEAPALHREWRAAFREAIDVLETELSIREDDDWRRRAGRAKTVLESMLTRTAPEAMADGPMTEPPAAMKTVYFVPMVGEVARFKWTSDEWDWKYLGEGRAYLTEAAARAALVAKKG